MGSLSLLRSGDLKFVSTVMTQLAISALIVSSPLIEMVLLAIDLLLLSRSEMTIILRQIALLLVLNALLPVLQSRSLTRR
jgi:hypothetical protein